MSEVTLSGHAQEKSKTSTLLKLNVLDLPGTLTEIAVGIRKPGTPLSGNYTPTTANLRLLSAEFTALAAAVANGGTVSFSLRYESSTGAVTAFTWSPA